jgi:uncharacterized protein (DUF1786 family)
MRVLAIDVGTGTQDVLLFDSEETVGNCPKLVMPSPTVILAQRIREATRRREAVLLTGVTMGGGPSAWAMADHLRAGLPLYATPEAARTVDDDLDVVRAMGITVVSEDEAQGLRDVRHLECRDVFYDEIMAVLRRFGVESEPDALAVAVFDHGAAPPGFSDRLFRFQYLAEKVRDSSFFAACAYLRGSIPSALTRLQAVARSCPSDRPLLVMDTAPAALLGALEDPQVRSQEEVLLVNVGNFHTLACSMAHGQVRGFFEHHTGELRRDQLERFLQRLVAGTLTHEEVFHSQGHGALIVAQKPSEAGARFPLLAVTGPRRALLQGSPLRPYFAVPHGDMMLTGCFGLLRAFAVHDPAVAEAVAASLDQDEDGSVPHVH